MNRLTEFIKNFQNQSEFENWCKNYMNKFVGDVPQWIVLFGLTEEYIDVYQLNTIQLTLEDVKNINKISKFGIKPNLDLLNEKNVKCIHYVDFNYNYNNLFTNDNKLMKWFDKIVSSDSNFDFSNLTYDSINNFSVKTLVSLVINNTFYTYDNNSINDFLPSLGSSISISIRSLSRRS